MRTVAWTPRRIVVVSVVVALICAILVGGTVISQLAPSAFQRVMTFRSVSMDSASDGWAIGVVGGQPTGVFLHYTGGSWMLAPYPNGLDPMADMQTVKMLSPSDGWAIANVPGPRSQPYGTFVPGGAILRYDGTRWNIVVTHARAELFALSAPSATDAWAVGDDIVMRYDGASWHEEPLPQATDGVSYGSMFFRSVTALPDGQAWAAGFLNGIFHYDGSRWTEEPVMDPTLAGPPQAVLPGTFLTVHDIAMQDAHHGWAIATLNANNVSENLILRYDGSQWTVIAKPSIDLMSLSMQSPSEGWAVGQAQGHAAVMRCHNGAWVPVAPTASLRTLFASPGPLTSVSLDAVGQGWTVGYGGALLPMQGGTWSGSSAPMTVSAEAARQYGRL